MRPGADRCPAAASTTGRRPRRPPTASDADVYIVGGANSAGQAAVFFSRVAKSVTARRARRLAGARACRTTSSSSSTRIDNVSVRLCTVVDEAHGDDHLEALTLRARAVGSTASGSRRATLFVFIGAQPRTDWLARRAGARRSRLPAHRARPDRRRASGRAGWPLDRDPWPLEASIPGVFVAGDVRADSVKRVASAVGEGAMAVTLVHRYLGHAMTRLDDADRRPPRHRTSCATLFLFEALDDEQLHVARRARLGR